MSARYLGRHWPDTVQLAPADHLLSPTAYQLVTRTPEPVHAGPDDATGLIRVRDVAATGAWTAPPPAWAATSAAGEETSS
ncbi:hypothetical protein MCAG_03861 [Micromonospora sp. ATCC 39149]|uniref:hypothetical protein n=1 Tax=Micromonospora sp. (strain ATCC 39149 / NRRL 15099 / SCC 1413) TaxID=219305 RepID=UPI0001A50596|nr:hypothetical protein [Micromonospora sp. ATCC 39149]EEP73534.1 hypothetical protein MCAG_03861 [Micromonospora sp. ATCC 39149]